jgi:hypothetical protein
VKELWRIGAVVAAGWGCLLAVFTLLLAGYGEGALVVVMFGASVILCWIIAAALLWWSSRNSGKRLWRPIPPKIASPALFAIAAGLVGLGVSFTWALYPAAFWIAVLGIRQARRERAAVRKHLPPRHPAAGLDVASTPETAAHAAAATNVIGPA